MNKLLNTENSKVLASKLRPLKSLKFENCYFTEQKVIAQLSSVMGGAMHDKLS